jgi:hypothetical protein
MAFLTNRPHAAAETPRMEVGKAEMKNSLRLEKRSGLMARGGVVTARGSCVYGFSCCI